MKFNYRDSAFESNSSSCHSICVSKEKIDKDNLAGRYIHFTFGEYGCEQETVWDTASYFYTAILESPNCATFDDELNRLKAILDKYYINYSFQPVRKDKEYDCYNAANGNYYYINHGGECGWIVEAMLNNEDMLLRFLFGNSCIETGSDNNGYDSDEPCFCAFETYWDYDDDSDEGVEKPHPLHNEEKYEYFFKGN